MGLFPAIVLAAAGTAVATVPGYAACHSFTISVSPGSVNEGGTTTATVSRDGNVNPSSVQVDTVDESAVAGRDYAGIHQRLSFTTETSQTFTVTTLHNPAHEGPQSFRIELSAGMGCNVNPHFAYGSPAHVTVLDTDPAPAATPIQSHPPTAIATVPATARATPAPTAAATSVPPTAPPSEALLSSPTPSESPTAASPQPTVAGAPANSGRSGSPLPVILVVIGVALVGGAGVYLYRRRAAG